AVERAATDESDGILPDTRLAVGPSPACAALERPAYRRTHPTHRSQSRRSDFEKDREVNSYRRSTNVQNSTNRFSAQKRSSIPEFADMNATWPPRLGATSNT